MIDYKLDKEEQELLESIESGVCCIPKIGHKISDLNSYRVK